MAEDVENDELLALNRHVRQLDTHCSLHDAWGGNPEALVGLMAGLLVDAWSDRDRLDALMERFNSPDRGQRDVIALMHFVREKVLAPYPR